MFHFSSAVRKYSLENSVDLKSEKTVLFETRFLVCFLLLFFLLFVYLLVCLFVGCCCCFFVLFFVCFFGGGGAVFCDGSPKLLLQSSVVELRH